MQTLMAEGIVVGVIIGSLFLILLGLFALAFLDYHNKQFIEGERKRFLELKTFILSLSHDFKAPLARISGLITLAKKSPGDPQYLELQQKVVNDMNSLLDELLNVIKLDEAERPKIEINFEKLVESILDNFKDDPEYKGVSVSKTIELDRTFKSDPWLVHTILYNLISNAFKYRKKDRYNLVAIEIKSWKSWIIISVADNGIGIPEGSRETIFNFQKRASSQAQGLGLGLYIVKNAVEKLDGAIDVTSTEGEGTLFTVYLPAR